MNTYLAKKQVWVALLFYLFAFSPLNAQPWAKKAAQAVFTLKTFDADGTLLASSNGFFVGEQGEALSCFAPFKGAKRAVIIDAQGKEWPVEMIIGANDMYDVAKFKVAAKKTTALSIATTAVDGSTVWLLPYSVKKTPACLSGTVASAEKFQGDYAYYTLTMQPSEQHIGCPVLNDNGEAIGMLQPSADAKGVSSYAVSAPFANDLRASGFSINDPAMRQTAIEKALPEKQDEALLSLYMAASVMEQEQYDAYVDRFIQKFPTSADGYLYRARNLAAKGDYAAADGDLQQAIKVAEKKDDAHYQYAQMMYQKAVYQSDETYSGWNLERALEESKLAYTIDPQPLYWQQQAQILYAQQQYDEAYTIYEELSKGPLRSADTFYAAAQCKLQKDEKKAALALLDSAVSIFTKPYIKTAVPYLQARAQLSMDCRRYQLAINDMKDIVAIEPTKADLWAEKASYELRVNLTDQALESALECMRLAPDSSDGYLMAGIAQCLKGQKDEGLQNLTKAKELGNSQAQTFIEKYSK